MNHSGFLSIEPVIIRNPVEVNVDGNNVAASCFHYVIITKTLQDTYQKLVDIGNEVGEGVDGKKVLLPLCIRY